MSKTYGFVQPVTFNAVGIWPKEVFVPRLGEPVEELLARMDWPVRLDNNGRWWRDIIDPHLRYIRTLCADCTETNLYLPDKVAEVRQACARQVASVLAVDFTHGLALDLICTNPQTGQPYMDCRHLPDDGRDAREAARDRAACWLERWPWWGSPEAWWEIRLREFVDDGMFVNRAMSKLCIAQLRGLLDRATGNEATLDELQHRALLIDEEYGIAKRFNYRTIRRQLAAA